jgi:hypothetical protein
VLLTVPAVEIFYIVILLFVYEEAREIILSVAVWIFAEAVVSGFEYRSDTGADTASIVYVQQGD